MRLLPGSVAGRALVAAVLLLAVGGTTAIVVGDRAPSPYREARTPRQLDELLVDRTPGTLGRGGGARPGQSHDSALRRHNHVGDHPAKPHRGSGRPSAPGAGPTPGGGPDNRSRFPVRRGHRRPPSQRPRKKRPPSATAPRRDPVVVGIEYIDAARTNAFYARYGGVVHGEDGGVQAQAVADYINATGGIGGRPLQLRRFRVDAFDGTPFDVHDQQMCSFFGEGPRPVAVVAALGWRLLHPCLAERGIPLITNWPTTADTASFARFADYLFAPGSLALDRFAAPYVRGLQAAGFFGRGARVGVVHYARPEFDRAMGALRSELGRAGVRIVADADLPDIPSTAQAARVFTAAETAILRFRAAGVNRVVSVDYGGTAVAIFMQTAEPQGYRPAYGLSTLNSPTFLRAGMPPRQLRGAVGIGWAPLVDVPAQEEGGVPAIRSQCAEIYRRASVATGDRSAYGQFSAFSLCDSLLLLRRALAGASSDSPATVRARIEALGSSYTSGLAMATRLDGAHHDGVSGYRVLRYDEGCSCFRYDGPVRSLDGP